jgi:ElaB/YqjD/DUF883 family membrane-anchored ribosome-binding protein
MEQQTQPQGGRTSDQLTEKVRELSERADETLQSARARLNETLDEVTTKMRKAANYADEQVHSNPWTAVGVGFGLSVAIGALATLAARR